MPSCTNYASAAFTWNICDYQGPHRFFSPLRNQGPTGDCWIQNHLCSDYITDSIPKHCYNLRRIYGLSCRANCINRQLPFGVLVSSSLTPFPFVLSVRGCTCRIETRAFIVFLYGARGSALALTPSCRCLHGSYDSASHYA